MRGQMRGGARATGRAGHPSPRRERPQNTRGQWLRVGHARSLRARDDQRKCVGRCAGGRASLGVRDTPPPEGKSTQAEHSPLPGGYRQTPTSRDQPPPNGFVAPLSWLLLARNRAGADGSVPRALPSRLRRTTASRWRDAPASQQPTARCVRLIKEDDTANLSMAHSPH